MPREPYPSGPCVKPTPIGTPGCASLQPPWGFMREQRYAKRPDGITRIKWAVKKYRTAWPPIKSSTPEESADALRTFIVYMRERKHLKIYGTMLMQMLVAQGLATETITDEGSTLYEFERAALIASFKRHN